MRLERDGEMPFFESASRSSLLAARVIFSEKAVSTFRNHTLSLVVSAFDGVALELGEGDEGHRPAIVDVGTLDPDLAVGGLLLDHLEDVLRARRPDWNHHDAADLELLQERRRNMVDAAGDDDLVERPRLFPAVVAVRLLGIDGAEFGIAALDETVITAARAIGERLDDLDRPHLIGKVREIGRLIAGAGADLEHLLAHLNLDRTGHAPHHARTGDGHTEPDIVIVDVVDDVAAVGLAELVARRQQKGALVAGLPDVTVADHVLEALEAGTQVSRILAAVLLHPADVGRDVIHGR